MVNNFLGLESSKFVLNNPTPIVQNSSIDDSLILDWLSEHATFIMFINDHGSDESIKVTGKNSLRDLIAGRMLDSRKEPIITIGRKIVAQGHNWIRLDDGTKIYLDPTELERNV